MTPFPKEVPQAEMTTIEWLHDNAPGFCELSGEERDAIMQFSLLWSLFEARALGAQGNAGSILRAAERWADKGLLTAQTFAPALSYFRNRYLADGAFTCHFDQLHLRNNDRPELVKKVLQCEPADIAEVAAALLIIIYRLRNNLFHGIKWAYEIRGQYENFTHASAVLMQAIELHQKSLE